MFNENVSINDFIFILVSLLIFLPVYFIRIMRIDFIISILCLVIRFAKRIVYAINTFLLVYCLAINPIMIWNREAQFSFQIPNVSLYIDVIPFYLFFFIVAIIYINFKVKDQLDKERMLLKGAATKILGRVQQAC